MATQARPTEIAIRHAAVRLFHVKGYAATTMREIAREVGIEAASLYNHLGSKQELLAEILVSTMRDAVADVRAAVRAAGADPVDQLRAAITAYVLFHEGRLTEGSISDTERRSLEPPQRQTLHALRAELGGIFKDIIRRGVRRRAFRTEDVSIAAICILSICARLPVWYRPGGRLSLEQVSERMSTLALRSLGVEGV